MGNVFYGNVTILAEEFMKNAYPTESYMLIGNKRKPVYVSRSYPAMWTDKERTHAKADDDSVITQDERLLPSTTERHNYRK